VRVGLGEERIDSTVRPLEEEDRKDILGQVIGDSDAILTIC
jgi:hypothetical protein